MKRFCFLICAVLSCLVIPLSKSVYGALNNAQVIDHAMAERIEELKEREGYSSEDFNACQITWTVRKLKETNSHSRFQPHEISFFYENQEVIKLVNSQDGDAESIQELGLNCLEFNNYVYLFFDTLDFESRMKFNLSDLSYVIYSSDKGSTWSEMKSLNPFSAKAKFVLPHDKFEKYVKIFGNTKTHVLSIFNLRDETTYLFDPDFKILKSVSVYNRLTSFDYPSDFHWYKNSLYLVRGSCENVRGRLRCPPRTYMETSTDFGKTWKKTRLAYTRKSFFLTVDDTLYRFYSASCRSSWFGIIPAINRANKCGYVKLEKLNEKGKWEKPKIIIDTAARLLDLYKDEKPILVWQDLRFHKSLPCGYIPVVGCIDSTPFRGPTAIYAGELDMTDWHIDESLISYKN